ncbi:MAG: hypothetical protein C5S47_02410 [Candidatus Methanogasteraceae archaeon]|nr:MAG: hypothetical protein C5S47_02410 [ANME-2 cluster archaeon]
MDFTTCHRTPEFTLKKSKILCYSLSWGIVVQSVRMRLKRVLLLLILNKIYNTNSTIRFRIIALSATAKHTRQLPPERIHNCYQLISRFIIHLARTDLDQNIHQFLVLQ